MKVQCFFIVFLAGTVFRVETYETHLFKLQDATPIATSETILQPFKSSSIVVSKKLNRSFKSDYLNRERNLKKIISPKSTVKRSISPEIQKPEKYFERSINFDSSKTSQSLNSNFTLFTSETSKKISLDDESKSNITPYIRSKKSENAQLIKFSPTHYLDILNGNVSSGLFFISLPNRSISDLSNISGDTSVYYFRKPTPFDSCSEKYNDKCLLSNTVENLLNLFQVLDTNHLLTTTSHYNVSTYEVRNFSDSPLSILMQRFNCSIEEINGLAISCSNLDDFYAIGEYLPNDTKTLKLSHSFEIRLLKPLFPHLKMLKNLTLSNNHHKFITKAFVGLENLENLDLSDNDIAVFLKAFTYVPNLKSLDLSRNAIIRVKSTSDAVSSLKNLQVLIFDDNFEIDHIFKEDLRGLSNCNITTFSLFNTTINRIEKDAFKFLHSLQMLEISVNYMHENALTNLTCSLSESVEILFFRMLLNVKTFPYDAVYCLKNTKVRKLYLGNNFFKQITFFPYLPNLQLLSLSNGSLNSIYMRAFENASNIEKIYLNQNKLTSFPLALSSIRNLKELYLDSQDRNELFTYFSINDYAFQNLTLLNILRLSRLSLNNLSRYCLYGLHNLTEAFLSITGLFYIEDFAFETLQSLEILDLRKNGISSLSNYTFYGLKNLRQLYLGANNIQFLSSVYPFTHSPSINTLLLQTNSIRNIPEGMFSNLKELQTVSMGNNKVVPWTKRIFHPNSSLIILVLFANNIDYTTDIMLEEFQQVTHILDMGQNPFNCSKCGMKKFQTFILNSNLSFQLFETEGSSDYQCANPESIQNEPISEVEFPEYSCQDFDVEVLNFMAIMLLCLLGIMIILISSLCYYFRWYVRYWTFHCKTRLRGKMDSFTETYYTFDAFIIYSSVDKPWIDEFLIPNLEDCEPRYKLCNHEKHFPPGRPITENILEAIDRSHKVILILTEDFIKSDWCMYEMHLAQHKLFGDTRDILILVKLKQIDRKLYSKNLSYVEKTRKCYMWTDSHIGQKLFWQQLRKQLGPPKSMQSIQSIAI